MEFRWKRQVAAGALTAAVFLIGSLSGPRQLFAQVKAAMVQDVDQPARQPFQATVQMGPGNLSFVAVPIPSGKRLVVEYVAINGAAASSGGGIQPYILINSSVNGGAAVNYYLSPTPSANAPTQFQVSEQVKIYADTLAIGPAYAGFAPSFLVFNATISGHLVSIP
jgi:hypothetical protein